MQQSIKKKKIEFHPRQGEDREEEKKGRKRKLYFLNEMEKKRIESVLVQTLLSRPSSVYRFFCSDENEWYLHIHFFLTSIDWYAKLCCVNYVKRNVQFSVFCHLFFLLKRMTVVLLEL